MCHWIADRMPIARFWRSRRCLRVSLRPWTRCDRLTAFELAKGTIQFTAASPLPDEVVRDIVRYRIQEIAGHAR